MKIVFLGTPEFGVLPLEAIFNSRHEILAVISQPDREKDKKGCIKFTPVKKRAVELNLPVYQFEKVSIEGIDIIQKLNPDAIVTAAYGQMLSEKFLSIPKRGVFNIHGSLLPRYRGASPMQASILNGDSEAGITIMKTVYKMDAGDMLKKASVSIDDTTIFGELHDTLSALGAKLIVEALDEIENGTAVFSPQDENLATYTKKLTKQDAHLDFEQNASVLIRKINAFNPSPSAFAFYNEDNLKIHSAVATEYQDAGISGTILKADGGGLIVKCGGGAIKILSLQAPGKKRLTAAEFLRGYKIEVGGVFK